MTTSWDEFLKQQRKKFGFDELNTKVIQPIRATSLEGSTGRERKLFNIHKRSLPAGVDTRVVFNISESEAKTWVDKRLRTKVYESGSGNYMYYDIVPVEATLEEKSVYFNGARLMQETKGAP